MSKSESDRGLSHQVACDGDRDELDEFVRAFEEAYLDRGVASPSAFLPPRGHPLHKAVLRELVRVDLEFGWERGCPKGLDDYEREFPDLTDDREGFGQIAYEEFRLRRRAGQDPSPEEYRARYGITLPERSAWSPSSGPPTSAVGRGGAASVAGFKPPKPIPSLPEVGDDFLDFRLIGDLGRGAFGRVYLARQGDLADRPVVLKVTTERHDESQTLAQLQHDHIVPIYSRHTQGALRAVCMPYLGSVTLRDVLDDLKAHGNPPGSGKGLLSSLGKSSERKAAAVRAGDTQAPGSTSGPVVQLTLSSTPGTPSTRHASAPPADRLRQRVGGRVPPWSSAPRVTGAKPGGDAGAGLTAKTGPKSALTDARATLGRMTYVQAVVWMAARLADGLAHAHSRGILHRDMKPANILVTDDGRPMLLDFNLAEDVKRVPEGGSAGAGIGGTFPYMAPEHLGAFRDGRRDTPVDARSDLFAFGVIVFEMLTGRAPFPLYDTLRGHPAVIRSMIADRQGPPPSVRALNPAVSPAVESIVRRCLEPDPARRYQSALDLAEDLDRHLAHRPLRHAPEPSRLETAVKCLRRNRRLILAAVVLTATSVLGAGLSWSVASRRGADKRAAAVAALTVFRADSTGPRDLLAVWPNHSVKRQKGQAKAAAALAPWHALADPRWSERSPAADLPAADRDALRAEAGALFLLTARSHTQAALEAVRRDGAAAARGDLNAAARACDQAARAFGEGQAPRALWLRRADLAKLSGDNAAADRFEAKVRTTPLRSAADHVLAAEVLLDRFRPGDALLLCEEAVRLAPLDYPARLELGLCHLHLYQHQYAETLFDQCTRLDPDRDIGWYVLANTEELLGENRRAVNDFGRVLDRDPTDADAYFSRAMSWSKLGETDKAFADLEKARTFGMAADRVLFLSASFKRRIGDAKGADRDLAAAMRLTPGDEFGWVARGNILVGKGDPLGALDAFEEALRLNPRSRFAMQCKAAVFSEHLGRVEDAIRVLDGVVALTPDNSDARASRAVLLARLGRRDAATAEAEAVLSRKPIGPIVYQIAGVYALTSAEHPADRLVALRLLEEAFNQRAGLNDVDQDPDLNPIRNDPEFQRLLKATREKYPTNAATPARTIDRARTALPATKPEPTPVRN